MARHAAAKGHFSKASLQTEWRNVNLPVYSCLLYSSQTQSVPSGSGEWPESGPAGGGVGGSWGAGGGGVCGFCPDEAIFAEVGLDCSGCGAGAASCGRGPELAAESAC